MIRKQTVVLTIQYDDAETDAPDYWPWAGMLEIPGEHILSMTWWYDDTDHVPAIDRLKAEGKL